MFNFAWADRGRRGRISGPIGIHSMAAVFPAAGWALDSAGGVVGVARASSGRVCR